MERPTAPAPASIILGLTVILTVSNLVRVTVMTPIAMVSATVLFLISPAALILLLLQLLSGVTSGNNAWLYWAAAALATLGMVVGIRAYRVGRQ